MSHELGLALEAIDNVPHATGHHHSMVVLEVVLAHVDGGANPEVQRA
jgi:hypothetical protein